MNNAAILEQLSPEELQNLISVAQNYKGAGGQQSDLPIDIYNDLDLNSSKERQSASKKFIKSLINYDGGQWTKGGATNKQLVTELKRGTIDANQLVQQLYRDAEKIRHTARAATELYEDIGTILEQQDPETAMQQLLTVQEKCRTLAVYGYNTGKCLDQDARELTTKIIKLPASMRHIEDKDEDDKELAFSAEELEQLNTARFQEQLFRQSASKRGHGHGYGRQQSFRGGRQSFGFQQRNQQQQQKHFFGKPRNYQSPQQSNNPFKNQSSNNQTPNSDQ